MANPNVTKTYLAMLLLFCTVFYTIFSTALIGWYFNSNIESRTDYNITVERFIGIPVGVSVNGQELSTLTDAELSPSIKNAINNDLEASKIYSTINTIIILFLIALTIWLFIPSGT